MLRITLRNEVATQLGWVTKKQCTMDLDKEAGLVRFTRCDKATKGLVAARQVASTARPCSS